MKRAFPFFDGMKKSHAVWLFLFTFLPFYLYAMHEVTPSAVAMADSTLMAVWIANFQNVLFFMINFVLN